MTLKGQGRAEEWFRGKPGVRERNFPRRSSPLSGLTLPPPRGPSMHEHLLCARHGVLSYTGLPRPPASFCGIPLFQGRRLRLKEVKCPDLGTLLVSGKVGFDPRSASCHSPARSCLLSCGALCIFTGSHPGPGLDCALPSSDETETCLLAAAAWNILTALPVAVFLSQCPGFPPAAWTPARLPTALH